MDLERVAAVIRPRSAWEAVDLGFGMVRAWWKPIWSAWLATVAPAWWLVWSLTWLATGEPWIGFLVTWWLRPLFDRVPLYVVSRRLFGTLPTARDVLRDLRRLWTRHLVSALTLQRLDPARSFDLPIWELEGLRGQERKARTALLQRVGRQNAVWLTFACSLLEGCVMLAILELADLLNPASGWTSNLDLLSETVDTGDPSAAFWWWTAVVVFLALTAIEPFYVAAGFSLYLSRRIHLEGWDVELAFRRLAARLAGRAALVILLLTGAGGLWAETSPPGPLSPLPSAPRRERGDVTGPIFASSPRSPELRSPSPGDGRAGEGRGGQGVRSPAETVREILAEPEFQSRKKVKVWRPKDAEAEEPREERAMGPGPSLDFLTPVVLVAGVALLVGLVVVATRGFRWNRGFSLSIDPEERAPLPAAVFGLDIRPESLPDDVPGVAWNAWERGEPALALGLLYRAAIAFLVRHEGLPVRESWTEGDCVDFVQRKTGAERAAYFARLTRAWQTTAYAHRPPVDDEARALCGAWTRHFGEAAS